MKFNVKNRAQHGQRRVVRKFAFLPVIIDNVYIWLEYYEVTQYYTYHYFWGVMYWDTISKKELNK